MHRLSRKHQTNNVVIEIWKRTENVVFQQFGNVEVKKDKSKTIHQRPTFVSYAVQLQQPATAISTSTQ